MVGVSGNVGQDLITFLGARPEGLTAEEYRYAQDFAKELGEQGRTATAEALKDAVADGVVTDQEAREIVDTFVSDAKGAGRDNAAFIIETLYSDGDIALSEEESAEIVGKTGILADTNREVLSYGQSRDDRGADVSWPAPIPRPRGED